MVGLLDYDLLQSDISTRIVPNLEIMKLATYYRVEENHFCRLLSLDEKELDCYDKIYFFSETGHKLLVPDEFKRANNVIYGGTAFTNKQYIPFENQLIDYTIPRILIYKDYLKQKYQEGYKNMVISHALDDTYYRMYAGTNKLPIPPIHAKKRVYLFDRDFFYPDWEKILDDISRRRPGGIYRLHPIVCHTLTEFFSARKCSKLARTTEYILDLNIPLTEVKYLIKDYKNYLLAEIAQSSNVYLQFNNSLPTFEAYCKNFTYIMNLLYAFWSNNIPIKIYTEPSPVGINNPIEQLQSVVSTWTVASIVKKKQNDTLLKRLGKNKSLLKQYEDILSKAPYAKTLFDQSYGELMKRGFWRL